MTDELTRSRLQLSLSLTLIIKVKEVGVDGIDDARVKKSVSLLYKRLNIL